MSSSERSRRHGEVRHLRDLRKEAVNTEKKNRKRKLINEPNADDDEDEEHLDVKDIDFRLAQDGTFQKKTIAELHSKFAEPGFMSRTIPGKTLRRLLRKSSEISSSERATLLWILAAGLYPQVALSDTHNSYKKDADQLFHTEAKGESVDQSIASKALGTGYHLRNIAPSSQKILTVCTTHDGGVFQASSRFTPIRSSH